MAKFVYVSCALLSILCTLLLFRGYWKSRSALLLWSSICFLGLALNNINLFIDMLIFPNVDIAGPLWRNFLTAASGSALLYGLIRELT